MNTVDRPTTIGGGGAEGAGKMRAIGVVFV